jgi:alpha-N-arabinofuranosidase
MTFKTNKSNEEAGIVIMQNNLFHYRLVKVIKNGKELIQLIKADNSEGKVIAEKPLTGNDIYLKISGDKLIYRFYAGTTEESLSQIGNDEDGTVCSTNKADGFIGPFTGMYCSSNGVVMKKNNSAAFDFFEYKEIY